jgi:hypothetical protein
VPFLNRSLVLAAMSLLLLQSAAKAEKVLSGEVCSVQVHKLASDIEWYKHLDKAEEAAKEQGKLIVWIHMVGKIDGAT